MVLSLSALRLLLFLTASKHKQLS